MDKPHGQTIVDVAIGILVHRFNERAMILITQRPKHTVYADYWELPGGKIEPNETPASALVREFREELDITIAVGEHLPIIEHVYPHGHIRLHPFYCTLIVGQPRNVQVAAHQWVTPDKLSTYRFPEANESITQRIIADYG